MCQVVLSDAPGRFSPTTRQQITIKEGSKFGELNHCYPNLLALIQAAIRHIQTDYGSVKATFILIMLTFVCIPIYFFIIHSS